MDEHESHVGAGEGPVGSVSGAGNVLLEWLGTGAWGGRDAEGSLERLCARGAAMLRELSTLVAFPDARSLLAFVLLDEYARSRGLEAAEAASVCDGAAEQALSAVDTLLARAVGREARARVIPRLRQDLRADTVAGDGRRRSMGRW